MLVASNIIPESYLCDIVKRLKIIVCLMVGWKMKNGSRNLWSQTARLVTCAFQDTSLNFTTSHPKSYSLAATGAMLALQLFQSRQGRRQSQGAVGAAMFDVNAKVQRVRSGLGG